MDEPRGEIRLIVSNGAVDSRRVARFTFEGDFVRWEPDEPDDLEVDDVRASFESAKEALGKL